jgi:hypothetical protein
MPIVDRDHRTPPRVAGTVRAGAARPAIVLHALRESIAPTPAHSLKAQRSMMETLVECPETGRREELAYLSDRDDQVLIVLRCSRFDPPAAVTCDMRCADWLGCRQAIARGSDAPADVVLARWRAIGAVAR